MTPDMAEKWLAENTIECRRFAARLTPGACADYRQSKAERCKGCERLDSPAPGPRPKNRPKVAPREGFVSEPYEKLAEEFSGTEYRSAQAPLVALAQETKKEDVEMAKIGICACGCGKEGKIVSRGLLHPCYDGLRREGRLLEFPTAAELAAGAKPVKRPAADSPEPPLEEKPGEIIIENASAGEVSVAGTAVESSKDVLKGGATIAPRNKSGHASGKCRCCQKEGFLHGRGLIRSCYRRHKRAGTLENYPPLVESARSRKHPVSSGSESAAPYDGAAFARELDVVLREIREGLVAKNAAYGDSALNPVRVFSKVDQVEQLRVRIDDKLSRMMRGQDAGEDTEGDLLGYLVLLRLAKRRQQR